MKFLTIFSDLLHPFDLILHILFLPNVRNDSVSFVRSVGSVQLTDVEHAGFPALQLSHLSAL